MSSKRIKGPIEADGSYIKFESGATTEVTLQAGANLAAATFTLPAATDTLVGRATTDTFTNKSIDGDDNTITDLPVTAIKTVLGDAYKAIVRDASGVPTSALILNANIGASAGIAMSKLAAMTASRIVATDVSGFLTPTSVTESDLSALSGISGNIQTQLDAKVDENAAIVGATKTKITYDAKGLVTAGADLAAGDLPSAIDATKIADGSVSNTEFQYIGGLTSDAQTQISAKADASALTAHIDDTAGAHAASAISNTPSGNLSATDVQAALNELQTDIDTRAPAATTVTLTGTQALTNKDYDGGTASNTSRLTVPKAATATLEGLTRKQGTLLYDTSLLKLLVDNGTSLDPVGSGSGAGGVTLIANPSDATGWSETGTVFATPVTTTTSGDLPLSGATPTAIQFVATGNGAEASHYNSYSVTTSAAMNGKLQVDFFFRPGTGFAASEWTVSVYQGSTRQTLSTDSSGVTYIPNTTGRFTLTFDAVASTAYTLRFARISGSGSATLNVCNVFLGWPFVSQVAAVSEWVSYTPTFSAGFGTVTNINFWYRRVGSNIEIQGRATTGTVAGSVSSITLPSGLTANTSILTANQLVGDTTITYGITAGLQNRAAVIYNSANGLLALSNVGDGASNNNLAAINVSALLGNSTAFSLNARLPIAEWAGSVSTAPAVVQEWAADDGSADVFGPNGALVPNVGFGTGTTTRVFTFQYPQQTTQAVTVELSRSGNGWSSAADLYPFTAGNNAGTTNFYGVRGEWTSSTTYQVSFGNQGTRINSSAASNGTDAWSTEFSAGTRFRVSKSINAALPFANASTDGSAGLYKAGQAPGLTTGATIGAGYVGQVLRETRDRSSFIALTSGVSANVTANAITLTAGIWLVSGSVSISGSATAARLDFGLSSTSATLPAASDIPSLRNYNATTVNLTLSDLPLYTAPWYVNISGTSTLYLVANSVFTGGTCNAYGYIQAVRIA